jgi:hypothetical protein
MPRGLQDVPAVGHGPQVRRLQGPPLVDANLGMRLNAQRTALRLGKYFGTSPQIWIDLQSDYELRVARQTTWKRVEPTVQTRVA